MSTHTSDFWKRLRQSKIVSAQQLERLRSEYERRDPANHLEPAAWCAKRGVLTEFQAKQLKRGRSKGFVYGDYVVAEPADQQRYRGWFRAMRRGTTEELLLLPLPETATHDDLEEQRANPNLDQVQLIEGKRPFLAARPASIQPPPPPEAGATVATLDTRGRVGKSRRRPQIAIASMILVVLLAAVIGLVWRVLAEPSSASDAGTSDTNLVPPTSPPAVEVGSDHLWARSSTGKPLSPPYLPPETQAVLRVRLAALSQHAEGGRILASLGPDIKSYYDAWLASLGCDASEIEVLTFALVPQGTTVPAVVWVLEFGTEAGRSGLVQPDASSGRVVWLPEDAPRTAVIGPVEMVKEIQGGDHAKLRRELTHLLRETHDTDHVTLIASPNFFFDEAQGMFSGPRRRLLNGMGQFWGQHAKATSIAVQMTDDVAFLELRVIAQEDWAPRRTRLHLEREVQAIPRRVTDFLGRVQLDPHWQPLALRFPDMTRFVAEQARFATEGRQIAVTAALPVEAIHNLLLASELALASPLRPEVLAEGVDHSTWTLDDVLAAPTSIRIAQKSLEFAAQDIVRQVRDELDDLPFEFVIEILGGDLQPEGITRNQQIRDFRHDNRPLHEILTSLVSKGNPVQNVTDLSSPEQKLVWTVPPNDRSRVVITTRSAADRKEWDLPAAFQSP